MTTQLTLTLCRIGCCIFLWFGIHGRILAKRNNHHLNQTQQVRLVRSPIVQIRQIDLPVMVHVLWHLDQHVVRGFHITVRSWIRMCVHQPDTNRDVVSIICKQNFKYLGECKSPWSNLLLKTTGIVPCRLNRSLLFPSLNTGRSISRTEDYNQIISDYES